MAINTSIGFCRIHLISKLCAESQVILITAQKHFIGQLFNGIQKPRRVFLSAFAHDKLFFTKA